MTQFPVLLALQMYCYPNNKINTIYQNSRKELSATYSQSSCHIDKDCKACGMAWEAVDTGGAIHCAISSSNNTICCKTTTSNTATAQTQSILTVMMEDTYGSENSQKAQL